MRPFHLAIFNDQSISLAAVSTKDGSAVERQIQSPRKSKSGIGNEANLTVSAYSTVGGISPGRPIRLQIKRYSHAKYQSFDG